MFDNEAFEEAWINALVHNDWIHGNPPSIYWYEDRMEIMSYGGLKEGLAKEDFFEGVTDPVNKELIDVFVQCDVVDRSGHGVPKVLKVYGKEFIKVTENNIIVTIPFNRINEAGNKVGNKVGNKLNSDSLNISQFKVLEEIRNNPNITKSQLMIKCYLGKTSIDKIIKTLKDRDYLRRIGSNKTGYWDALK